MGSGACYNKHYGNDGVDSDERNYAAVLELWRDGDGVRGLGDGDVLAIVRMDKKRGK